jgi:TolB-like protein/DNA-binding SARP family transcriptional activator
MADQGQTGELLWSSEATLDLLGPVRLGNSAGDDLTPKARKTRALLAILGLAKSPVSRLRLTELLWGDRGEEQAKASLRQALYDLRALANSGHLTADRHSVALGPKKLSTDVARIRHLIEERDAEGLASALDDVECPILGTLDDVTPELDEWLRDERARVATALVGSAISVANDALGSGHAAVARRLADALERLDPLDERVTQLGLRADLAAGDRPAAMRRYRRIADRLQDQLEIAPSAETEALLSETKAAPARFAAPPPAAGQAAPPRTEKPNRWLIPALVALAVLIAGALWFTMFRAAPAEATPTVAVLPFDDLGQKQGYFASGVSDEILNLLGRQKDVKVLGRVSAAQLADPARSLATARTLGVTYLLDGSVRTSDDQVLVIARLTRVSDGAQIWSERYQRKAGDIFSVQGEIAGAVASRLAQSFAGVRPQETSPEVYDRYLAARQLTRERRDSTLIVAERLLREAIRLDPSYAPALAELSQVIMLRANHPTSYGPIPLDQARNEARGFAQRAMTLNPNLGEAYAALGFLTLSDESSAPYYRKAVELDPQRPEFHRWYAQTLLDQKHFEQAVDEYKRAVAIDPLWELNYEHLNGTLYALGRDSEARRYEQQFMRLSTDQGAKLQFRAFMANSRSNPSEEVFYWRKVYQLYPQERQSRFKLATALAVLGERREAAKLMQGDALASSVLTNDWRGMAAAAVRMGADYWTVGTGYWNLDSLLLATGQSRVIVGLYDRAQPLVARGVLNSELLPKMTTVFALLQNGRAAEAQRLWAQGDKLDRALPNVGKYREERDFDLALNDALRGRREPLMALMERWSRTHPANLAQLPAMSLRYSPFYRTVAGDPRFAVVDERMRAWTNVHRVKAGLKPISRDAWLSDPKTLLTKN